MYYYIQAEYYPPRWGRRRSGGTDTEGCSRERREGRGWLERERCEKKRRKNSARLCAVHNNQRERERERTLCLLTLSPRWSFLPRCRDILPILPTPSLFLLLPLLVVATRREPETHALLGERRSSEEVIYARRDIRKMSGAVSLLSFHARLRIFWWLLMGMSKYGFLFFSLSIVSWLLFARNISFLELK